MIIDYILITISLFFSNLEMCYIQLIMFILPVLDIFFVVCNQVFRLCEFNLAQFALINLPSLPSQNPLVIVCHDQRLLVILVAILIELQV